MKSNFNDSFWFFHISVGDQNCCRDNDTGCACSQGNLEADQAGQDHEFEEQHCYGQVSCTNRQQTIASMSHWNSKIRKIVHWLRDCCSQFYDLTFLILKKKNNDEKRRKMTGKNSKEESTRANVQIQDQKTNKAIQDALQHIQDSDKSSSAVRDLVDETVSVEGK